MTTAIRPDIALAVFGRIDPATINDNELELLSIAKQHPGVADALAKVAQLERGTEAVVRLAKEHPAIKPEQIHALWVSAGGEPAVFRDAIEQYLATHKQV